MRWWRHVRSLWSHTLLKSKCKVRGKYPPVVGIKIKLEYSTAKIPLKQFKQLNYILYIPKVFKNKSQIMQKSKMTKVDCKSIILLTKLTMYDNFIIVLNSYQNYHMIRLILCNDFMIILNINQCYHAMQSIANTNL